MLTKINLHTQARIKASQTILVQFAAGVIERRLGNSVVLLVAVDHWSDMIHVDILEVHTTRRRQCHGEEPKRREGRT